MKSATDPNVCPRLCLRKNNWSTTRFETANLLVCVCSPVVSRSRVRARDEPQSAARRTCFDVSRCSGKVEDAVVARRVYTCDVPGGQGHVRGRLELCGQSVAKVERDVKGTCGFHQHQHESQVLEMVQPNIGRSISLSRILILRWLEDMAVWAWESRERHKRCKRLSISEATNAVGSQVWWAGDHRRNGVRTCTEYIINWSAKCR